MNVATAHVIVACYKLTAYDSMGNKRARTVGKQYHTTVDKMAAAHGTVHSRVLRTYMDDG